MAFPGCCDREWVWEKTSNWCNPSQWYWCDIWWYRSTWKCQRYIKGVGDASFTAARTFLQGSTNKGYISSFELQFFKFLVWDLTLLSLKLQFGYLYLYYSCLLCWFFIFFIFLLLYIFRKMHLIVFLFSPCDLCNKNMVYSFRILKRFMWNSLMHFLKHMFVTNMKLSSCFLLWTCSEILISDLPQGLVFVPILKKLWTTDIDIQTTFIGTNYVGIWITSNFSSCSHARVFFCLALLEPERPCLQRLWQLKLVPISLTFQCPALPQRLIEWAFVLTIELCGLKDLDQI